MKKINKNKGFTIFELLVVVAVIGIISTILVVNWRQGEKQYLLQRTAQKIVQDIRKAQDLALTSYRHQGQIPPNYGVYFTTQGPTSYKIFTDDNDNNQYDSSDSDVETINLENGITISALSSEPKLHLTFSLPDAFTIINPSTGSATITIKRTGLSCPQNCKNIIITNTGQVKIE